MFRLKILMVPVILGVAMVLAPTNPVWAKGEKVTLCHIDQETGELKTIRVGVGAVATHLSHHDEVMGACPVDLGEEPEKVEICHAPPGNPNKMFTLLVDADEVAEHTDPIPDGHGDALGPCL